VNEIVFINVSYFENDKAEKTIDAYKNTMEGNIKNILLQSQATRYADVLISSLRIKTGKLLKVTYYSDSQKLDADGTGYQQLVSIIDDQLIKYRQFEEKIDNNSNKK